MIRPATILDLPWLRKLYQQFVAEYDTDYPMFGPADIDTFTALIALAFQKDPSFCLMVAVINGQLVGFLGCVVLVRPIGLPAQVITPHWMYVEPTYRGCGLAKHLAQHALAFYRTNFPDVQTLEIQAKHGNTLWETWGAVPFLVTHHAPITIVDRFITGDKVIHPKANGHDVEAVIEATDG